MRFAFASTSNCCHFRRRDCPLKMGRRLAWRAVLVESRQLWNPVEGFAPGRQLTRMYVLRQQREQRTLHSLSKDLLTTNKLLPSRQFLCVHLDSAFLQRLFFTVYMSRIVKPQTSPDRAQTKRLMQSFIAVVVRTTFAGDLSK